MIVATVRLLNDLTGLLTDIKFEGLPRRFAPRNQAVSQFKNMEKINNNIPFMAKNRTIKCFKCSLMSEILFLFPIFISRS